MLPRELAQRDLGKGAAPLRPTRLCGPMDWKTDRDQQARNVPYTRRPTCCSRGRRPSLLEEEGLDNVFARTCGMVGRPRGGEGLGSGTGLPRPA